MTAKTLVRERTSEGGVRELTARNVRKVTRYRENGIDELEEEVRRMEKIAGDEEVREVSFFFFRSPPPLGTPWAMSLRSKRSGVLGVGGFLADCGVFWVK